MFREIRIEKKARQNYKKRIPKQATRRFWIGMMVFAYLIASLYVMTNSIKLGLADALWISFRLIN